MAHDMLCGHGTDAFVDYICTVYYYLNVFLIHDISLFLIWKSQSAFLSFVPINEPFEQELTSGASSSSANRIISE